MHSILQSSTVYTACSPCVASPTQYCAVNDHIPIIKFRNVQPDPEDIKYDDNNSADAEEYIFLAHQHGYEKLHTICDTTHSDLFKAKIFSDDQSNGHFVVIKRYSKKPFKSYISNQRNIIRETQILKFLSGINCPMRYFVTQYVESFESENAYYLVMEYIESELNLQQFIDLCFRYIEEGQMKLKHYQSMIKLIFCRLALLIRSLHHDMKC